MLSNRNQIASERRTLRRLLLPPAILALCLSSARGEFTTVIDIPPGTLPPFIQSDTQINVHESANLQGGLDLGRFDGSTSNIEFNLFGGRVSAGGITRYKAFPGSRFNMEGGVFDGDLEVWTGASASISGGTIYGDGMLSDWLVRDRSEISISGGTIRTKVKLKTFSSFTMSGGSLDFLDLDGGGATATIRGGTIRQLELGGGRTTILGGDFRWDDVPIEQLSEIGSSIDFRERILPEGGTLSGVFADGTPFVLFEPEERQMFGGVTTKLENVAIPMFEPKNYVASRDSVPLGIRDGETLLVDDVIDHAQFVAGSGSYVQIEEGGDIDFLKAHLATVDVSGGRAAISAVDSAVTLSDGDLDLIQVFRNSSLVASGGELRNFLVDYGGFATITGDALVQGEADVRGNSALAVEGGSLGRVSVGDGARVEITGGVVSDKATLRGSAVATMSGGLVGNITALQAGNISFSGGRVGDIALRDGGTLEVSGGQFDNIWGLQASSTSLIGRGFAIDGEPIQDLEPHQPLRIEGNSFTLSGILLDGTPFEVFLSDRARQGSTYFAPDASLFVSWVPEPASSVACLVTSLLLLSVRQRCSNLREGQQGAWPAGLPLGCVDVRR